MTGAGRPRRRLDPDDDRPAGRAARHVPGRVPLGAVRRPLRLGRGGPRRGRRRAPARDHRGRLAADGAEGRRQGLRRGRRRDRGRPPHPRTRTTRPARGGSPTRSPGPRDEGRAALIPYVVAGYPDADGSFAAACAAIDAGADLLEVGLPYSDPLADGATLQRASQGALANGATFDRSLALVGRIAAARPGVPVVRDGLREPADRRRRRPRPGACRSPTRARPGSSSRTSRPTRAAPFEAVAVEAGIAVVYLVAPTTGARPPRRRRRPERRVPVLRVARRRDRRPDRRCRRRSRSSSAR